MHSPGAYASNIIQNAPGQKAPRAGRERVHAHQRAVSGSRILKIEWHCAVQTLCERIIFRFLASDQGLV